MRGIGAAFKKLLKSRGGRAVDDVQGMITGFSVPQTKQQLLKTLPWAGPAAWFGGKFLKSEVVDPIREGIQSNPYKDIIEESQIRMQEKMQALDAKVQYEDLQRRMMKATMRLAISDPHLYNEVMAGRSLPKDAVVFGGQPRTDLMEELALSRAQGQSTEQPSSQDELMQELGV